MTTFDEREQAFENKFARDQELEFRAMARRNKLAARWAAERMGLAGAPVEDYVEAVVRSDLEQPGEHEVLRKIAQDLKGAGVGCPDSELRQRMDELLAQARDQIRTGQ